MSKHLLLLSSTNSCRSQIAHGFFEKYGGEKYNIYSAGIESLGVSPMAIQFMTDVGIDISGYTSNALGDYKTIEFDYILTLCDHARENCPWFPSDAERLHHHFIDPSKIDGVNDRVIAAYIETRDSIEEFVKGFLEVH